MHNKTLLVTFSAPEHSGKTTLAAAFAKLLINHGVPVLLPPDSQRDAKMALPMEELLAAFKEHSLSVMLMESNAT